LFIMTSMNTRRRVFSHGMKSASDGCNIQCPIGPDLLTKRACNHMIVAPNSPENIRFTMWNSTMMLIRSKTLLDIFAK
jgi:hypothetical protein